MSNEKKIRIPLWIYPSVQDKIMKNYKEDNCKSPSEFIEKAVLSYTGYLTSNDYREGGTDFDCEPYTITDKGARSVSYANREMIEYAVMAQTLKNRGNISLAKLNERQRLEVKKSRKPK